VNSKRGLSPKMESVAGKIAKPESCETALNLMAKEKGLSFPFYVNIVYEGA
jgi:hypothetical protein